MTNKTSEKNVKIIKELIQECKQKDKRIQELEEENKKVKAQHVFTRNKATDEEKAELYDTIDKTLDTFLKNVEGTNGFFYHFINMKTGKREWNSELSIIDTGIFICGAITAGEYFGGEIKEKAEILYKKINSKQPLWLRQPLLPPKFPVQPNAPAATVFRHKIVIASPGIRCKQRHNGAAMHH